MAKHLPTNWKTLPNEKLLEIKNIIDTDLCSIKTQIEQARENINIRREEIFQELLGACKELHRLIAYPVLNQSGFNRIRDILKQAIAKAERRD